MSVNECWRPVLTGGAGERARELALEVASRLADPERVEQAVADAARAHERAGLPPGGWSTPGLSGADAGIALLCAQLDRLDPDAGWDRVGHARLGAAAEAAGGRETPLGLYDGVAGLGFSAERLASGRGRYRHLLGSVDDVLVRFVSTRCPELARAGGMPVREWDLISGVTGLGVYLLVRLRALPAARVSLEQVLGALVHLSREADGAPRWATPADHLFDDMREAAPNGNVNCGLAHGAPGPLALMSLALLSGVEIDGQSEAVRRVAGWLADRARPGRWGPEWPAAWPLGAAEAGPPTAARPGWCYGNAGVGRALWLAGRAVDEPELEVLATQAVRQALDRQEEERPLDSPTFCHGVAGLAQVALRMAAESGEDDVSHRASNLCLELVDRFDADAPLGYRDVIGGRGVPGQEVDNPSLLSGATGPALVLLAAATRLDPGWDRAMLLS